MLYVRVYFSLVESTWSIHLIRNYHTRKMEQRTRKIVYSIKQFILLRKAVCSSTVLNLLLSSYFCGPIIHEILR
jgi:hypothetical protein